MVSNLIKNVLKINSENLSDSDESVTELLDPKGNYLISRIAVNISANMIKHVINNSKAIKNKRPIDIRLETPSPVKFNAYYKIDGDYGNIYVNDSLANTYFFLSKTRKLLKEYLKSQTTNTKNPSPEVIEEIRELLMWLEHPHGLKLDLSKSLDLADFSTVGLSEKELYGKVLDEFPELICMTMFIIAHEYGHMLLYYDEELSSQLMSNARDLIHHLIDLTNIEHPNPKGEKWISELNDKNIFGHWQEEIASDIFAIDLCYQIFKNENKYLTRDALAIFAIINKIIELRYPFSGYYEPLRVDKTYPMSFLRYIMHLSILKNYGWDEKDYRLYRFRIVSLMADLEENPVLNNI